jgi:hypothetical protein
MDDRPIGFIKEASKSIRIGSLVKAKLIDGLIDFSFFRDGTQAQIFLRGDNRGGARTQDHHKKWS